MKILHVNMSLNSVTGGGTVERTLQLHNTLIKLGIDSQLLTIHDPNNDAVKHSQKNVTYLPCLNKRWFIPTPSTSKIKELVKQADVIHLMNHWTLLNILVYIQARKQKKPYIVCPAGALTIFGRSRIKKNLYQRVIGKSILSNASAAIAISPDEVQQLEVNGVDPQVIFQIPNGINETDFDYADGDLFRKSSGIDRVPYILFLGRLNSIKGPDLLIEAYAKISDHVQHNLAIAGPDDGMEEQLKQLVLKLGLKGRVFFTGHLAGDLKSSAYHGADLMVIPSRHEAMSIVALEAAISGTPVLLTDRCGFSAMADAGGAIETPATTIGLSKGLETMLVEECGIEKMGIQGRTFAQENYSWTRMGKKFELLCSQIKNNALFPTESR